MLEEDLPKMAESRNEPSGSVAFDPNGDVSAKSDPAVAAETSAPTQQQRTITKARKRTKTGCLSKAVSSYVEGLN